MMIRKLIALLALACSALAQTQSPVTVTSLSQLAALTSPLGKSAILLSTNTSTLFIYTPGARTPTNSTTLIAPTNSTFIGRWIVGPFSASVDISTKLDKDNGTATGLIIGDATPSRAAIIDNAGYLTTADTTDAEVGFLSGVTSAIQAQIDAKLATNFARVVNIKKYGAVSGSGDDYAAFTNALANAGDVVVPQGTWDLASDLTISQTNRLIIEAGAIIRPATNVTVNVRGYIDAPNLQFIDTTSWVEGKGFIFNALGAGSAITRQPIVWAEWWGPSPNNPNTADTKALKAWMYSIPSGVATPHGISAGVYKTDAPLFVSNRFQIFGLGRAQINYIPTNSNVGVFEVAASSGDVSIRGFVLVNSRTSSTNTFTNLFGIKVGVDSDRLTIDQNSISAFNGGGIYIDGGTPSQGSLYSMISENQFSGLRNDVANGGNGLWPAHAIVATNVVSDFTLLNNNVGTSDAAYWIDGTSGTNILSGHIHILGGTVEGSGQNGTTATNAITIKARGEVTFNRTYLEGNQANFGIYVEGSRSVQVAGGLLASDYLSVNSSGTLFGARDVAHAELFGINFNNCLTNYIAQLGTGLITADHCWFDLSGTAEATSAQITNRLVGNVLLKGRSLPTAGQIPATDDSGHLETWKSTTGSGNVVLDTSPTIVTPTIASFANANHNHQNSAGGGTLDVAAIASGTLSVSRGGSGAATLTGVLKGNGTSAFTAATQGTDFYQPSGTDVAVADGGTGASTAIGALDSLITAEATVASATTTDIGAVTSQNVQITGTVTITGFGTSTAGKIRKGRFAAALTLTHNASSLILPSAANITTAANDRFEALSLGSGNWLVYFYQKADGTPLVGAGIVGTVINTTTPAAGQVAVFSSTTTTNIQPTATLTITTTNAAFTGGITANYVTATNTATAASFVTSATNASSILFNDSAAGTHSVTLTASTNLNTTNYSIVLPYFPFSTVMAFDLSGSGSSSVMTGRKLVYGTDLPGTIAADNSSAGNVGEYSTGQLTSGSATSLTTATAKTITSVSLTAGDWEVWGVIDYVLAAATSSEFTSGISQVNNTLPSAQDDQLAIPLITTVLSDTFAQATPRTRVNISATTTIYLVGKATFSAGTQTAYGTIRARRVR